MTAEAPPPLHGGRHALLLDFDGTLVDFAPSPDAVRLRPGSLDLLQSVLHRLDGALSVVTGRRIADIDGFLAPLRLNAIGVHGQEIRQLPGDIRSRPVTPELDEARRRVHAALSQDDPVLLEDKGAALVLHYRTHPDQKERVERLGAAAVAGLDDIHAVPGHAIVEIRQRGIGKGDAIGLVSEWPDFAGKLPVFIGDDTTDEDGFRAAQAAGGHGIKVGPGSTDARYRLADVGAVHQWLAGTVASNNVGTSLSSSR